MALIEGNSGDNTLTDTIGDDTLDGKAGNDFLRAVNGGRDILGGDTGDDTALIDYSSATQSVTVNANAARAFIGPSFDTATDRVSLVLVEHINIRAGSGNDSLATTPFAKDTVDGGAGTDLWFDQFTNQSAPINLNMTTASTASGQTLSDGSFVRRIEHVNVDLSQGNDVFRDLGGTLSDTVDGAGGNDFLVSNGGKDTITGGSGDDTLTVNWSHLNQKVQFESSIKIFAGSNFNSAANSIYMPFNEHLRIFAGAANDSLTGYANSADTLSGGGGRDILNGGSGGGNDVLIGGGGNDRLIGENGADTLQGENGNDTLDGGSGNDLLHGGAHVDTALFLGSTRATVNLNKTGNQNTGRGIDKLVGIENVTSGDGSDILIGNGVANTLTANDGNDKLVGGGSNDKLFGGNDNDTLDGGGGNDRLNGGANVDTALFFGSGNVTVNLNKTGNQNTGRGIDQLVGIENLSSGSGNDMLVGNDKGNVFQSDGGNDTLFGEGGNDRLVGEGGGDLLVGGRGNDQIIGGSGTDMAAYSGGIGRYNVTQIAGGKVKVVDTKGIFGTDILSGVEKLKFGSTVVKTADAVSAKAPNNTSMDTNDIAAADPLFDIDALFPRHFWAGCDGEGRSGKNGGLDTFIADAFAVSALDIDHLLS